MTSKTHLLTQLPRRTIKQELICSKASFVDRVRTLKLFQYFQTASWSHWWVRHAGTSARSPPGDGGETKLQPLLLQKKRKMFNLTLRSLKREKEQLYVTFSCPSWQLLWKNGCVHQFWYLYPLVSNFHDIWNHLLHELHRSHRNHGVRTRLSLLGYLFAWHYRGDFYKSTDAALIDICGKHWIWTLTLIKEFFPQGKTNKCGDEPELTDGVFWHQMLCQMVSPSSLSSSTLLRLLHSWVLPGRVQTCSSSLHPSAARLIGFSSSISSRRDALLWWGEVSETGGLCCEGDMCSLPSASFGVLLHLVTGGLLHICFSTLTHSQPGLWPCCLCVCFGGGLGCHSHLPSPLSGVAGLNSWSDNSPLRPICFQSECLPWSLWTSTASIITARSKRFQSLAARPRHSPGVGYTKDACTQTTHKHGFLC